MPRLGMLPLLDETSSRNPLKRIFSRAGPFPSSNPLSQVCRIVPDGSANANARNLSALRQTPEGALGDRQEASRFPVFPKADFNSERS